MFVFFCSLRRQQSYRGLSDDRVRALSCKINSFVFSVINIVSQYIQLNTSGHSGQVRNGSPSHGASSES
jgi:hypothetical protein